MQGPSHLLVSWYYADVSGVDTARDRRIVAWAGLAPDIDVLAYVAALAWYRLDQDLAFENVWRVVHHRYTHGLAFVLLTGVVAWAIASGRERRWRVEYAGRLPSMQSLIDKVTFAGGAVPRRFPGTYITRLQATLAPGNMGDDLFLHRAAPDLDFRRTIWWQAFPVFSLAAVPWRVHHSMKQWRANTRRRRKADQNDVYAKWCADLLMLLWHRRQPACFLRSSLHIQMFYFNIQG